MSADVALAAAHWPVKAAPQKSIGMLFERLKGQLGNKLDDLYAQANPDIVQREWAQGLHGFTTEEVATGVAACRSRKFAPTLGEFLQLCRPSLDPEVAWYEAEAGLSARRRSLPFTWSHPAVCRAALRMHDSLRQGVLRACRSRWEQVLRTEFAAGWGEGVPPLPVAQLVNRATCTAMPESIRLQLAAAGIALGATR